MRKSNDHFPIISKALEDKGISPELRRTIGVVALAMPEPKRLAHIGFLPKRYSKRDPLLGGFFKPGDPDSTIAVNRKLSWHAREQTLIHELGHCLDFGVAPGRCMGHDLGFGNCWSMVYRVYISEVFSIRCSGDGNVAWVDNEGRWYSAKA